MGEMVGLRGTQESKPLLIFPLFGHLWRTQEGKKKKHDRYCEICVPSRVVCKSLCNHCNDWKQKMSLGTFNRGTFHVLCTKVNCIERDD